ncbi:MAG: arsenic transporter [Polyangiaceae bacterium]|nr:arsenic transporter [Polyangiaceae bacterium]
MIGAIVFAITYVLISVRRLGYFPLGRPGAALLGAVACVALGVIPAREALGAVDGDTILLLFGMMGIGAFLELDGFASRVESWVALRVRTRRRLLTIIVWGSGAAAALVTNDAVCVLGAPIVVALIRAHGLPPAPYLIALATAANTGSVATLVGNPQNMLCASLGHLDYRFYLLTMLPVAVVGLAINHAVIALVHRRDLDGELRGGSESAPLVDRRIAITLAVVAGTTALYLSGIHLAWTAVAGFTALLLVHRRDASDVWPKIEWAVLLFFSSLFIVVEGLMKSGVPAWLFEHVPLAAAGESLPRLSAIFLVGSNIVSNVPFILVIREQMGTLANPRLAWQLLAMASTFAGNLTLLGSVANIIVAERARSVGGLGFFTYLRVGLPVALSTTLIGTVWLMVVAR